MALREDGIEDIPVWLFEANWTDDLIETLEWQTDVLTSPTGAEQRRAMRRFPRISLEFRIVAVDRERTYFDNVLMRYGARDWWVPLWQEALVLSGDSSARLLPCLDAETSTFTAGDVIFIRDGDFFTYGMAVIDSVDDVGLHLTRDLLRSWPAGTIAHRVKRARLTEQPKPRREADNAITAQVRFQVAEQNAGPIDSSLTTYRGFPVLFDEPNEVDRLEYGYERMLDELDNKTGIPRRYDSAGISFPSQRYAWLLEGNQEYRSFKELIYRLRGRQGAIWLPTFNSDFAMVGSVTPITQALTVEPCGFVEVGGPSPGRQDILIELFDGTRIMRRILAASLSSGNEVLALDEEIGVSISANQVMRISFLTLSRLNQDVVEIQHKSDTAGAATAAVTFRSVPNLRQPGSGF